MKLSVVTPYYDDFHEATGTIQTVRQSLGPCSDVELITVDVKPSASLPKAKNHGMKISSGDAVLFLYPGIFPLDGSVQTLLDCLNDDPELAAVCGRWCNARGKVEVGYNVRRFPTFCALLFDILLLNKILAANPITRRYKMHDFDHQSAIAAEHASDCVFMVRREVAERLGGFDERYVPGWFDQLDFCHALHQAQCRIRFEPEAQFISNENVPLVNRIVADQYPSYRHSELLYIRRRFGSVAWRFARICVAIGMIERLLFSVTLPESIQRWFIRSYRVYVNDEYIRKLRSAYWSVLKDSVLGRQQT